MKKKHFRLLVICLILALNSAQAQWSLTGNAGTDPTVNFIGTTDAKAFKIKTNNVVRFYANSAGNVGIGNSAPAAKLDVTGVIKATGGTSTDWNSAFAWGDHSLAGYLKTESDPKVGANTLNFLSKWNGSALVASSIFSGTTGDVGIGNSAPTAKLDVTGVIKATGGSSTDWNTAFGWGDHSLAGYLKTESDPEVGANTLNYLSKWNGTALSTSNLYSSGNFMGLNTTSSIGAAQFVVSSPTSGYGGMYVNTTGSAGLPFYGYANNGNSNCWTYCDQATSTWTLYNNADRFSVESDGDVRIGQTVATSSRLDVLGNSANTTPTVNIGSNYTGNFDVRAVNATSVAAPGYGIGVFGTGGYIGLRGEANATTYTGASYGVYGTSSGSTGTRIGVYGTAFGGTENWGGYFSTKVYTPEIRVGTTTGATGYIMSVNGKIICNEMRVQNTASWPDFVFADNYELKGLDEVEAHIKSEKHLPGVPSACEVEENGVEVGEMQKLMLQKIEELTLYIIDLKKENQQLNSRIQVLEKH